MASGLWGPLSRKPARSRWTWPPSCSASSAASQDGGYVCSEIVGMTAGYEVTLSSTGSAALEPVWLIITNTVSFYVDGTDGTVRQAE